MKNAALKGSQTPQTRSNFKWQTTFSATAAIQAAGINLESQVATHE